MFHVLAKRFFASSGCRIVLRYHSREDFGRFWQKLRTESSTFSKFINMVIAWSLLTVYDALGPKSCKVVKFEGPEFAVE